MRGTLLAGYGLIAVFILAERQLRQGHEASTLEAGAEDAGSTRLVGAAFGLSIVLTPVLARLTSRRPRPALGFGGLVVMLAGLALRIQAARVLGPYYTRTLRIQRQQAVVDAGPYTVVRHPGYLADIVLWTGLGLSAQSWPAAALLATGMSAVYLRRIQAEEAMLEQQLGEQYRVYAARTKRLVPGLY
ncbi:MAG: isoprenylcysteine carboxylmethyltransferase family protein [Chloroflexi bacterium]|nr:isoprenylcysteine carboxylmethyltransferase family protein [Chloroflexota bacterium]